MVYQERQDLKEYYDSYDNFVKKHYPKFKESFEVFQDCCETYANSLKGAVVLCQGGGRESRAEKYFKKSKKVIAIDLDKKALQENLYAREKIVADISDIPMIESESIDVVFSEWVLEHVQNPARALGETARVLKKGGLYIFETPNINNPIMGIFRLIKNKSNKLTQRIATKYLPERGDKDVYPAVYRANKEKILRNLLLRSGFEEVYLGRSGCPGYFRANKFLLFCELNFEKLLSLGFLKYYQAHFIGVYRKKNT